MNGKKLIKVKWQNKGLDNIRRTNAMERLIRDVAEDIRDTAERDAEEYAASSERSYDGVINRPYRVEVGPSTRRGRSQPRGAVIANSIVGIMAESDQGILSKAAEQAKGGS